MTNTERQIFAKNFLAGRTSRIVSAQNGSSDVMAQFADPYNSGTLEETNDSSVAAPMDTTKGSDNDNNWAGTVPGGSNEDSPIYGAISIIQEHIASLGNDSLLKTNGRVLQTL